MKGHVRRRGKSSWAVVIDIGFDERGKRRQKWHSVKGTKRDAEQELVRLLNELHTGRYVEPANMTVAEYLDHWLDAYARSAVSPKTRERYEDMVDAHIVPAIGRHKLSKLKPLHVQAFYTDALVSGRKDGKGGLSAQTVLHFHRLLNKAFGQALKWQLVSINVVQAVEPPRPRRMEMRALDETETAELIERVRGTKIYLPVMIALTTGLRRGEILALRWKDVDFESRQLIVNQSLEQTRSGLTFKPPKTTRSRRSVALPSLMSEILADHKLEQSKHRLAVGPAYENRGLVCARDDGSPWPPDTFSTNFASMIRRSKFTAFRFHDLRHTHATQLLRQGVHPKIVSERLGHSNIGITLDTYSHVLPGMQEDAIATFDAVLRASVYNRRNTD